MKRIIPVIIAAVLASGGAYAQSIEIGPGGVGIDPRSPRERAIDREIRREERARERDRYERRRLARRSRPRLPHHHDPRGDPPRRGAPRRRVSATEP